MLYALTYGNSIFLIDTSYEHPLSRMAKDPTKKPGAKGGSSKGNKVKDNVPKKAPPPAKAKQPPKYNLVDVSAYATNVSKFADDLLMDSGQKHLGIFLNPQA
jgi:hypothetical protein